MTVMPVRLVLLITMVAATGSAADWNQWGG